MSRLASAVLLLACLVAGCPSEPGPPNVVLVTVDTLRADRMGIYGYDGDTTPRIDAFFRDHTVVGRAITSAPCTVPAMRQLLTGRLDRKADGASLPERLASAGYETAAVVSQHQFHWDGRRNYDRGFSNFDIQGEGEIDRHRMTTRDAREVADRALRWLDERSGDRPFFLWLHFFDPHDPYDPPLDHRDGAEHESGDRRTETALVREPYAEDETVQAETFAPEVTERFRRLYDGEIRFTDAQIGRVLSRLEELGLADDTIVVLTSDHGEQLGEGVLWDHCKTLHGRETRVPLLVRDPARAGRRREVATTTDVVPTILARLDLPYDAAHYDGVDLATTDERRPVSSFWRRKRIVQDHRWKLYLDERDRPVALYDLSADPNEESNVLPGNVDVATALLRRAPPNSPTVARRMRRTTNEAFQKLKSLGYVE